MTFDEWLAGQDDGIRSRLSSGQLSWLRAAFEAGRAIERNACAALADHWGHHFAGLTLAEKAHVSWMIRDAIRERAELRIVKLLEDQSDPDDVKVFKAHGVDKF